MIRIDHYIHLMENPLAQIEAKIDQLLVQGGVMAGELDALKTEVAETKTVIDSAIVFIQGLKQKLDEAIAAGDPAALTALAAELDAKQGELAAAIATEPPPPSS